MHGIDRTRARAIRARYDGFGSPAGRLLPSYSRRSAGGGSPTAAAPPGLEAAFLRMLGARRLAEVHPECQARSFRAGEEVFSRDDVGDAQPFALVVGARRACARFGGMLLRTKAGILRIVRK